MRVFQELTKVVDRRDYVVKCDIEVHSLNEIKVI